MAISTLVTPITLSTPGAHFIGGFEGFEAYPYMDGGRLWTVGYGHLIKDIDSWRKQYPDGITKDQAAQIMQADVASTIQQLMSLRLDLPLQHHQDAVISLVYNIGIGSFRKSIIYASLAEKASDLYAWEAWRKDAKGGIEAGLVKRRAAEMKLFVWGLYS